jgi:hypothetical protein
MRQKSLLRKTLLPLMALPFLFGCSDSLGPEGPQLTRQLVVVPEEAVLGIGESLQLTAMRRDGQGRLQEISEVVSWETSESRVAEVTLEGTVRAVREGRATILVEGPDGHLASALIYVLKTDPPDYLR